MLFSVAGVYDNSPVPGQRDFVVCQVEESFVSKFVQDMFSALEVMLMKSRVIIQSHTNLTFYTPVNVAPVFDT